MLESLEKLVAAARRSEHAEVEARFGSAAKPFCADVGQEFFDACLAACESFDGWERVVDWHYRTDFFLVGGVRASAPGCFPGGIGSVPPGGLEGIRKSKVLTETCALPVSSAEHAPAALRVCLSHENPVEVGHPAGSVVFTREKRRKQFKTVSGWSMDFSEVTTASGGCSREVEMEIEARDYILGNSDAYVAKSILLKAADFLPDDQREAFFFSTKG